MCALPSAPSPCPPLRTGVSWPGEEGWRLPPGSLGAGGFTVPFTGVGSSGSCLNSVPASLVLGGCGSPSHGAASDPAIGSEAGGGFSGQSLSVAVSPMAMVQPESSPLALSGSKGVVGLGWEMAAVCARPCRVSVGQCPCGRSG